MARKKPFSGKQKKVQLQEKKEKQRASAIAYDQSQAQKAALQKQRARGQASDQDKPNETGQPQTIPAIGLPILVTTVAGDGAKSSQKSLAKAERYKLKFKLTTEVDIEEAKRKTCSVIADENADTLVLGFDELYYSTDDPVGFPVRPKWDYSMTKDQLEAREEAMFETWLSHVYTKHGTNVGHFEHNLETWRQLWRVLEVSDLILIVVDVRHPSLHFPPELYAYINKELQKAVVLVINKVDMAGLATQEAWVKYMQDLFPALTIVKLSSFPDIDQIADEGVYMKQYKRLNDIKKNDDMKQQILDSKCAIMQACANSCTRLPTQKEFIETYIQTLKDADAKQPNPNQSAPGDNSPNQSAPGDDKEDCLSDTGAISEDCESDDGLDTSTEGDDEMNGYSTQPTLRPYTTIGVVGKGY
ncbi:hypothetical protein SARC_05453 [Sphaeroforma arctica JP610]|uniref:Guanine nucleotide-binding protein-like 3 N-terminal domain-containing protein n=1 Tax=Sphaeroforma arctica JP610 TaxID=667725 RepID=A0A0L0G242_9EUKA|nr:hypothetical protein SARC_05453 [Sphaeroforma arctica JP610]KNC82263.1 hypothetical protein SARC_05453 [Sphaeroforma arctica JP610]|eukprot:XP_014156165.1 hypothetical protein SARC_05453 [Sphaeroforma arctica JP610]